MTTGSAQYRLPQMQDLTDRLRALHRPWYEINGVRHDHTVYVPADDLPDLGHEHICRVGVEDSCDPHYGEHQALACVECRQATEDGDPAYPIWPCATIRLLDEVTSG